MHTYAHIHIYIYICTYIYIPGSSGGLLFLPLGFGGVSTDCKGTKAPAWYKNAWGFLA